MDKWIEKWERKLASHQQEYDGMTNNVNSLLTEVDFIENEKWLLSQRMDELCRKISERQKPQAF